MITFNSFYIFFYYICILLFVRVECEIHLADGVSVSFDQIISFQTTHPAFEDNNGCHWHVNGDKYVVNSVILVLPSQNF